MKDALGTDGDPVAWQAWSTTQNQLWQLRQPAPPLVFPGEQEIFLDIHTQVREEEQIISPPFTRSQENVSMRRRKKRKQGEDSAPIGQPPCCVHWCMTRLLVARCHVRVVLPTCGWKLFDTPSFGLLYLKRVALCRLTILHSWKLECLDISTSCTSVFIWMMCLWAPPDWLARLLIFIATAWNTAMINYWISADCKVWGPLKKCLAFSTRC